MTSQTPDMQAVLERLEKLERQNRRMKRAGAAALVPVDVFMLCRERCGHAEITILV